MFKAKKQYAGFIEIAPAERSDLEAISRAFSHVATEPLAPHHTKLSCETSIFTARSYWGALFAVQQRAKLICKEIAGDIDYIIVGVEEK